jgi:hypothetical protein
MVQFMLVMTLREPFLKLVILNKNFKKEVLKNKC